MMTHNPVTLVESGGNPVTLSPDEGNPVTAVKGGGNLVTLATSGVNPVALSQVADASSDYQANIIERINKTPLNISANNTSIDWTYDWTQNEISGGTNTESGDTNQYNVAASNGAGGRAIKARGAVTVESGKHYLVMFQVDQATNLDGGIDGRQYVLSGITASAGDISVDLPSSAEGIYGFRWTSNVDETTGLLRLGIGTAGAAGAARSVRITKPAFREIPNLTDDFPPWGDFDLAYNSYDGYNFSSGNSGLIVATGNITTPGPSVYNSHSFGFGTGDSFANGSTDWPQQLCNYNGLYSGVFHGEGYAGEKLIGGILSNFQTSLDAYDYDWCVIQGGVNDINGGESVADMKTAIQSMCFTAISKGIKVKVLTVSPWKNAAGWSAGEQTLTDEYNTWVTGTLPGLYNGWVEAVNIYTVLEGDANPDELSNTGNGDSNDYDSGDGLHPNAAGMIAIANAVLATL